MPSTTAPALAPTGTILDTLAAGSPILVIAYLLYLVAQQLIPALLLAHTLRALPAQQRAAVLRDYLRTIGSRRNSR